jgi:hypothetical protein
VASPSEDLTAAFIAGTLPKERWTHEAHLRVGLWHLMRHDPAQALTLLRTRIRRLNEAHGVANNEHAGYHETITRFYVWAIREFLRTADLARGIEALAEELIRLRGDRGLPLRYYSRERLFSPLARRQWVEPDLAPLA